MTSGTDVPQRKVTGIGIDKAAQIYYRTQSLTLAGANYADLAIALDNACKQLATAGTAGITTADCAQVRNATKAVAMSSPPSAANAQTPVAPVCPTGSTPSYLFQDDLEAGATKWVADSTYFKHYANSGYARSGKGSLLGVTPNQPGVGSVNGSITMATPITVPAGRTTYFWFAQYHLFDYFDGVAYDIGRVEYNTGTGWQNARSLFTENGPNAGAVYQRDSRGYIGSRLDLTSLHGKQVRLRFVIDGDLGFSSFWAIDDVKAYHCTADKAGPVRNFRFTVDQNSFVSHWERPEVGGPAPITGYRLTVSPAGGTPWTDDYVWSDGPDGRSGGWSTDITKTYTITMTAMSGDVAGTPAVITIRPTTTRVKKPTRAGGTVTIAGTVYAGILPPGATPPARMAVADNGRVTVSSRPKGTTNWSYVGEASVGKTGVFTVKNVTSANLEYQVRYESERGFHDSISTVVS